MAGSRALCRPPALPIEWLHDCVTRAMGDRLLRFGVFELDSRTRQLTRAGRRVRVQEQPLRLLEILLEDPGRLVARHELVARLWPSDVHVDFDLGLTGAVRRLRAALGDSADNPRFVETVPKVGFRFLAPVEIITAAGRTAQPGPRPSEATLLPAASPVEHSATGRSRRSRATPALLAGGLVLAVGATLYAVRPKLPPLRVTRIAKLTNSGRAGIHEPLFTGGERLYYSRRDGAAVDLRDMRFDGTDDESVARVPPGLVVRGLSSDQRFLGAISLPPPGAEGPSAAWLVPVEGGPPRRLGSGNVTDLAWSPDGRTLALADESTVAIADATGDHVRRVGRVPGDATYLRWSPDGSRVRLTVLEARGQTELWEMAADGSDLRPLHFDWTGPPTDDDGAWTPNGRFFVFASRRGDASNLWALDGRSDWIHRRRDVPVPLTNGPLEYFEPLPSPDGSQVFALGVDLAGALLRYDAAARTFVPYAGGPSIDHVSFTRDGAWMTYVAYPGGALWRARADGHDALQLTTASLAAYHPAWSPDGQKIVFTVRKPGQWAQLYVVSTEGGPAEPLGAETEAQGAATWTPDGRAIIYGRDVLSDPSRLILMRYDLARRVAEPLPSTAGLYAPVLSPDGTLVAAQAAGDRAIVLVDLRTLGRKILVPHDADYPAWSQDGRYLYFNTLERGADRAVFRVRVADGHEERVADVPFATRGVFASWTGLAPDDSVLLLADRSRSDVYVLSLADR